MSPTYKSLLILLISGGLFTVLLVSNQNNQTTLAENDSGMARAAAQILNQQLNDNINAISEGLVALANSALWQNSAVSDWPRELTTQRAIYEAAGLNFLGIHSNEQNTLYIENSDRSGLFFGLESALKRLYRNQRATKTIQTFKDLPAIVILVPIKNIENQIIGSFIGVKLLDENLLRHFHYVSKAPVVLLKNHEEFSLSIDTSPDILDFSLIQVEWPEEIQSSIWKLALMVKKRSIWAGTIWVIILGSFITLTTLILVWRQIKLIQSSIKELNEALNLDLPLAEQIKRLTIIINTNQDVHLLDCSTSIKSRFEQLSQQKKTLSFEIRKLNEDRDKLEEDKSHIEIERDNAVAAPRLKSEFLSRMGDEITTPMKSVVSMLKLLSEYSFEAEPKQLLNIAKRSTRTLVDNLNNILDFSKLDADMLTLKPKAFSVRELVDDLSSELSHFANEKNLSLQSSSDPKMPAMVTADAYRIRQILRNILGNAIRFTKDGEVSLFADVTAKRGYKLLRFTIADTGIGISPDAQKGVFDSLQQSSKLSNSSFAGRLRLIVSKKIAELMGGEIGVSSEIGKGSQFWFTVTYEDD